MTASKLKERGARPAQIRDETLARSALAASLKPTGALGKVRTIDAIRALVAGGMTLFAAKRGIEAMIERGSVVLAIPGGIEAVRNELAAAGIAVRAAPGTKAETFVPEVADTLTTDKRMAAHITDALATGDAAKTAAALGDAARAIGMARIARDTGLGRESLYKALSASGNPSLETVLKVLRAVGLRVSVEPEPSAKTKQ